MELSGAHHRVMFVSQHEKDGTPSDTSKGKESNDEKETIVKVEPTFMLEIKKRKCLTLCLDGAFQQCLEIEMLCI